MAQFDSQKIFADFLISAIHSISGEQIIMLNILSDLNDDDAHMKFKTVKDTEGKVHKIGNIYYLYFGEECIKQFNEDEWVVLKPFLLKSWDNMVDYYIKVEKIYFGQNTFNPEFKKFVKGILLRFRSFIEKRNIEHTSSVMNKQSYHIRFDKAILYGLTIEEKALSKTHKFESLLLKNRNQKGQIIENSILGFNYYMN